MSCSPDTGTVGYTQYLGAVTLHVDLSGRYLQGLAQSRIHPDGSRGSRRRIPVMESSSHILIQAHISTDPTCAELPLGPKCKANSMTVWTASPTVLLSTMRLTDLMYQDWHLCA